LHSCHSAYSSTLSTLMASGSQSLGRPLHLWQFRDKVFDGRDFSLSIQCLVQLAVSVEPDRISTRDKGGGLRGIWRDSRSDIAGKREAVPIAASLRDRVDVALDGRLKPRHKRGTLLSLLIFGSDKL